MLRVVRKRRTLNLGRYKSVSISQILRNAAKQSLYDPVVAKFSFATTDERPSLQNLGNQLSRHSILGQKTIFGNKKRERCFRTFPISHSKVCWVIRKSLAHRLMSRRAPSIYLVHLNWTSRPSSTRNPTRSPIPSSKPITTIKRFNAITLISTCTHILTGGRRDDNYAAL